MSEQTVDQPTAAANGNGEQPPQSAGKAVAKRAPDRTPLSQRDPVQLAQHFAASGFFPDAMSMSQAVVKFVAGEELGFAPMAAMQGIHIIEGKPSLSANLMATLIKRDDHYDYKLVAPPTHEKVAIEFLEDGESLGVSEFTIDQAKRAGLVKEKSGWVKFPEAMLFARAMSQGVRWYCPDVTAGSPAYVPEELGADVDEQGEPITVTVVEPSAGDEPVAGETVASADQVEQIEKALEVLGVPFDRLSLILGSLGVEAPENDTPDAIGGCLRALPADTADQLLSLLHGEGDQVDEKQGEEVAS